MFRKISSISLIISLALGVALAQQAAIPAAPSAEHLREHVTYLASEKLEGRRTGTKGADEAAQYIATEFSRLGLRPGGTVASSDKSPGGNVSRYLQFFPYVAAVDLGKDNLLTSDLFDSASLRLGDDWLPVGLAANGKINAPAVFAGYGLNVSELNYNDYSSIDATNRIVVAVSGTPDGDNPHGQFARYEDIRWKSIAARNAGAKGLIVVARAENFKDDRLSRLNDANSRGDAGIPVAVVSKQSVGRLILGATASELETAARAKTHASITKTPVKVTLSTQLVRREAPAANVIGILEGADAALKNETIVIGAHYDHLGLGGAGSLAQREGEIHYGADDNASGTAGVIELARVLARQNPKPRRTVVFIAFGGEEEGLLGSNYYVNHPVVPLANTIAMINMDMIGRMKSQKLTIGGVGTAPEWRPMIESANLLQSLKVTASGSSNSRVSMRPDFPMVVAANGSTIVSADAGKQFVLTLNEDGFGPSDHSSFYAKQIPVLFFWTGTHEDYHKPSDTADKINYEDEARILTLAVRLIKDLDAADKRPTYTVARNASTGRSTGFRVYLGTIPNYADSNDGVLLDGVREDSPAAKAGLKAGDRIVKLAGRDVRNVDDYTYSLGEMQAGQEYEMEVKRGGEKLTLKLTPAPRKQ